MSENDLRHRLQAEDFRLSTGATLTDHLATYTTLGRDRAARLVEEYRRFLYLAASGSGVAVPSPLVDEVWHRHLQDTRAYQAMAGRIGHFVHHTPGRPPQGRDPAYTETLSRYEMAFGTRPPPAIWPRRGRSAVFRWLPGCVVVAMLAVPFLPLASGVKTASFLAGMLAIMGLNWLAPWTLTFGLFQTSPASGSGFLFGGDGCGGDGGGCGGD